MDEIGLAKIEGMIYIIRGQKVMIDSDLANLYDVETSQLNRAVKRNSLRFPQDFMFQLTKLRSFLLLEKGLSERISKLESGTNKVFKIVFERLDSIEDVIDAKLPTTKKKIGLKE